MRTMRGVPAPGGRAVLRPGQRKPVLFLRQWLWLLLTLVLLGLVLGRAQIQSWAAHSDLDETPRVGALQRPAPVGLPLPALDLTPMRVLSSGVWYLASAPAVRACRALALVGLTGILLELSVVFMLMVLQRALMSRCATQTTLYRIRLPQRSSSPSHQRADLGDQDLFERIANVLHTRGRLLGRAPWAAFLVSGRPDLPCELMVLVSARRAAERERIARSIGNILSGLDADAQVERVEDRLSGSLQSTSSGIFPGRRVIGYREFGLRLGPQYPIRLIDETRGADLLGPVLKSLQPSGAVILSELQIIVRPTPGWRLSGGFWKWRGRTMWLKLSLEQQEQYALAPDIRALEAKLAGAAYEVTLRGIAVGEGAAATRAVSTALDALQDALGEYQMRRGSGLQQLVACGGAIRKLPVQLHTGGAAQRIRQPFAWRRHGPAHTLRSHERPQALSAWLALLVARAPRFAPPAPMCLPPLGLWHQPVILSASELAGLWHLPTQALGQLVSWLPNRVLPVPPQAFIGARPNRIAIGIGRHGDGHKGRVGPGLDDLRQGMHVTAGMGAGKTRLATNLCQQLLPYGITIIDGKADDQDSSLAGYVRRLLPREEEQRLVILDLLDAQWPVGLNPLAGPDLGQPGGADRALGQVLATFARIDPGTWEQAPGMRQFLQMATLLVLETEQLPNLALVKQVLIDAHYRARLLERAQNPEVKSFWAVTYPRLGESQKSSRDALLRRFDLLLTTETTRYLLTQPEPTFDLLEAIETGRIVIIPIPHAALGSLAGAITMLLFQAFVRAAFSRAGSDRSRSTYALLVDEFQILVDLGSTKDVQQALSQLRGFGIAGLYFNQALVQLDSALQELAMINTASRVLLQTRQPDAAHYAKLYEESGLSASDISAQDPAAHQYAVIRCDGLTAGPFSMEPLPWPAEVPADAVPEPGDWRGLLPPDSPYPALDRALVRLAYEPGSAAPQQLAALPEQQWQVLQQRWKAIAAFQRQYILQHPGVIPDRLERQLWLSRLWAARPRTLVEINYFRWQSGHGRATPQPQASGPSARGPA